MEEAYRDLIAIIWKLEGSVEGPPKEERMAKVIRNPIVQGISGKVGGLVFRQMP
jgi:hypothetical protein